MRARNPLGPGVPVSGISLQQVVSFTPTITIAGSTFTSTAGRFIKVPGMVHMWVEWQINSAGGLTTWSVAIPNGYVSLTPSAFTPFGVGFVQQGLNVYPMQVRSTDTSSIITNAAITPLSSGQYGLYAAVPTTT